MPKRPPYADSKTTESGLGIAIRSFTYSTNPPTSKDTHTHTHTHNKKKGPRHHTTNTTTSAPAHTFIA